MITYLLTYLLIVVGARPVLILKLLIGATSCTTLVSYENLLIV